MNERTGETTFDPDVVKRWLADGDRVSVVDKDAHKRLSVLHPHRAPEPVSAHRRGRGVGGRVPGKFKVRR